MSARLATLEDAWNWYSKTRENLKRFGRLGRKHWNELDWNGTIGRDDDFKGLEAAAIETECQLGLSHLDDVAVLILFSVFESIVREHALILIRREKDRLTLDLLLQIVEEAEDNIEQGSFHQVLKVFKIWDKDLVEQVNQVRKYRNWVAHGRSLRVRKEEEIDPGAAYSRLKRFLEQLANSVHRNVSDPDPDADQDHLLST